MKTSAILSGLAAVGSVLATPTTSIKKRDFSNTPPIEVRGNGKDSLDWASLAAGTTL